METQLPVVGVFALFALGFLFGLKHAMEVDHVVAVSTIVSEHRSVFRSALVGALWGVGHTASLAVVGILVLVFRISIPASASHWLEFGVALMIIALGVVALARVWRDRPPVHMHRHMHAEAAEAHVHVHFHADGTQHVVSAVSGSTPASPLSHSHAISQIGFKPILVGAMHGLAGSAGLTLLVLTQIRSVWLGLSYLVVFGVGSTLGMLFMSGLIGLPFAIGGGRAGGLNLGLQTAAGALSIAFGVWYAYTTTITQGLWQMLP